MRARAFPAAIVLITAVAGCSFLVDFTDAPPDADVPEADASTVDASDIPDAEADVDAAPNPCETRPNGYNFDPSDPYSRCCDASAVRTVTDDRCGTCEIKCNTGKGQKCKLEGPHYYCAGCTLDSECWSGCCSTQFDAKGLCAASVCSTGACDVAICKDNTHCVVAGDASNYCAY